MTRVLTAYQAYEYKSLKTVTSEASLFKNKLVSVPSVYHYDPDMHVMVMQDAGTLPTLLNLLCATPPLSAGMAAEIGSQVAKFIAGLHNWGRSSVQGRALLSSADAFGRTAMDTHGYQNVVRNAAASGITDLLLPTVMAALAEQDRTCDETAVMGDFWSANMLVDIAESATSEQTLKKIWIIDWENSRYGSPVVDVSSFVGDCYLISRFYDQPSAEALRHSFLATYAGLAQVDPRQVAISVGTFWIMWTKARGWGSEEELRECIEKGVEYIHAGWDGSREGRTLSLTRELVSDNVRARI